MQSLSEEYSFLTLSCAVLDIGSLRKMLFKKSDKEMYLDEISSSEDHEMISPLVRNQLILDKRCKRITKHYHDSLLQSNVRKVGTYRNSIIPVIYVIYLRQYFFRFS